MSIWHDIDPSRITPTDFIAVIEIPKGCKNKYELDKDTGFLILDRVLSTSTHYPATVRCYPIGVVMMQDGGEMDYKIIAIPFKDPNWNIYKEIDELPPHIMDEISHFFRVYKQLEGKDTTVFQVKDRAFAELIVKDNINMYKKKFEKAAK